MRAGVTAVLGLLAAAALAGGVGRFAGTPTVVGWSEQVALRVPAADGTIVGPTLTGKLDTGAETSSIDARDIHSFEKNGADWVRFNVPDSGGKLWPVEAEVVRTAVIRRAGADRQSRLVVRLGLCVAGKTSIAEFTLTDRRGQEAAVLVGRAFLAGRFVVDASVTDTAPKACER